MTTTHTRPLGYRAAVEFIAINDEPLYMTPEEMEGMASVHLAATLFHKEAIDVARDVVKYRQTRMGFVLRHNGSGLFTDKNQTGYTADVKAAHVFRTRSEATRVAANAETVVDLLDLK